MPGVPQRRLNIETCGNGSEPQWTHHTVGSHQWRTDPQPPKLTRNHAEKEQRIQDALAGIKDGKYTSFQAAARDLQVKKPTTDLSTEECNARQVLTSLVHLNQYQYTKYKVRFSRLWTVGNWMQPVWLTRYFPVTFVTVRLGEPSEVMVTECIYVEKLRVGVREIPAQPADN